MQRGGRTQPAWQCIVHQLLPAEIGELSTGYYQIQSASALTTNADSLRVIAPDILWRRSQPRIRSCPVMPSHRGRDERRRSIKMKSGDRERAPATRSVSERELRRQITKVSGDRRIWGERRFTDMIQVPFLSFFFCSVRQKDGVEDELLKRPV